MKSAKIIILFCFVLALAPQSVCADTGRPPTASEVQSFTQRYNDARAAGDAAFDAFMQDVTLNGTETERNMLANINVGLTAAGEERPAEEPQGFMGDPDDPGPEDWSNYDIQTDADGNVTGFKEKNFEEKDADGDGEISDEEREDWNKKDALDEAGFDEEDQTPEKFDEIDKNGDGELSEDELEEYEKAQGGGEGEDGESEEGEEEDEEDEVFERDCWVCKMPPPEEPPPLNECHGGSPGPCDPCAPKACDGWQETYDDIIYDCHECYEKDNPPPPWCDEQGWHSGVDCGGACPPERCVGVWIDSDSGMPVEGNETMVRGAARKCYGCVTEITWIIIIWETPFGRVVLKEREGEAFQPESVVALADPKKLGDLVKDIKAAKAGLNDLSSALAESLTDKRNPFNENCFNGLLDQFNPAQFFPQIPPVSFGKKGNMPSSQMKGASGGPPFGNDPIKQIKSMTGPILACGTKDGEKELSIFDAAGKLVNSITPDKFEADPNIITNALNKAESLSQIFFDAQSKGLKGMASDMATKAVGKAQGMIMEKMPGPKGEKTIVPDDPLFIEKEREKEGFFGSTKKPPKKINLGAPMKMGNQNLGTGEKVKKDPEMYDQWGIRHIGYKPLSDPDSAWHIIDGSSKNVVVAVIDSGLDMKHPDGPQYVWSNPGEIPGNGIDDDENGFVDDIHGWNFRDENNDMTDLKGHGTFVAGIIAAKRNNGIGVSGINPGAVIMPLKVTNKDGETNSLNIYRAIVYAVDHGAQVINVSLGGRGISKIEQVGLNYAANNGVFVAVASGNTGEYIGDVGPAALKNSFTVGAIDIDGRRSTISSVGPNNAVLGPGELIYSIQSQDAPREGGNYDRDRDYHKQSGTSFSTPMVSATTSLMLALNPALTPNQITDILINTAQDMKTEGWDDATGGGTLDATAALKAVNKEFLTVMLNELRVNKNPDKRDRIESIDVFATVRGEFKEFYIEVGRGEDASRFQPVAGPFTEEADFTWVARLDKQDIFKSIAEWTVRIRAIDNNGKEKVARALLMVE